MVNISSLPMKLAVIFGALLLLPVLFIAAAAGVFGGSASRSQPTANALADIPPDYRDLYMAAANVCPGLDWTILAAIGKIESNHGRSTLPGVADGTENSAHARGPMQFLQSTFDGVVARHPIPPGGKTPPSPWDKHDAIYAAAFYLCDNGARDNRDLRGAIWNYNHADWYVDKVLAQAQNYGIAARVGLAPSAAAQKAIDFAMAQLGLPYVWGGDGPAAGDAGFDCSGLTTAAYAAAGIALPRTADSQYRRGPLVPPGQPLLPGDLVFYGNPNGRIHHVGLYLGNGQMVNAPTFNKPVQLQPYRYRGDDFAGASRPALNPM